MSSPTTDPLAPFRAAASTEQRAACLHPPDDRAPVSGDGWLCIHCVADCAAPEQASEELTADRLDDLERRAREASERAGKATAGPWGHKAGMLKHYCFSTDEREDFGFSQQYNHWEDGHEVPAEANCIFVAAARADVPALAAAVLEMAAEVRRLTAELWRLREEATRPAPRSPEEEEAMDIIRRAAESLRERDTVAARDRVVGMLMRHSFDGAANSLLDGESLSDVVAGLRYYGDKPGCDECITAVESLASGEPPRAGEEPR